MSSQPKFVKEIACGYLEIGYFLVSSVLISSVISADSLICINEDDIWTRIAYNTISSLLHWESK
jgi:hypothetical protein